MIKKGLASELFLWAFYQPGTGYELTKRRQNSKTSRSQTYKILDELVSTGYLIKHENKYRHDPDVLFQDVKEYINENYSDFGQMEMKYVEMFLSLGPVFTVHVLFNMEMWPIGKKINVMEILCQSIGMMAANFQYTMRYVLKSNTDYSSNISHGTIPRKSFAGKVQDIEEIKNQINEKMRKKLKGGKNTIEKKMVTVKAYSDTYGSVLLYSYVCEKIPDDVLNTFCKLWNHYLGTECAMAISTYFDRMQRSDVTNFRV